MKATSFIISVTKKEYLFDKIFNSPVKPIRSLIMTFLTM